MKLHLLALSALTLFGCSSTPSSSESGRGLVMDHDMTVRKCGVGNYVFRHHETCGSAPIAAKRSEAPAAPIATAKPRVARLVENRIEISQQVTFETGRATITASGKTVLDEVAEVIRENGAKIPSIEVGGHTDLVGTPASNMKLSELRAQMVRTYLISKGVAESKLTAKGYGMTAPKYEIGKATRAELASNRRVEFTVQ